MKNFFLSLLALLMSTVAFSQSNVAYVYSTEILNVHPEYIEAKKQVEVFAENAKIEVDVELDKVKTMFNLYESSSYSMNTTDKNKMQEMIISMEKEANAQQEKYFGKDGLVYLKQKELLQPVEEKIVKAIEVIANNKGYDIVFDLSIVKNTIFQSSKINITALVIKELGIEKAN